MGDACRELCSRAGEPLAGSAGAAAEWVGIEWPKPRWHADRAALSEGLPPALAELEDGRARAGRKLALRVFQRAARADGDGVEVIAFRPAGPSFRVPALPLARVAGVLGSWLEGGPAPAGSQRLGPELLVCTDGRHDRCCAVHGRPVHLALQTEIARRRVSVGIAEVSHLGGHRFAANCLALPAGHLYGRLEPSDAPALVDAVLAGRVLASRSRGRLGAPELAQVAEAFLREQFPDLARCDVELPQSVPKSDGPLRVAAVVYGPDGAQRVAVECRRASYAQPTSCDAPAEEPTLRWQATRLL